MEPLTAEFERVVKDMEWEDVVSTLKDTIYDFLGGEPISPPPSSPPSSPPPPPPVPAELGFNTHPQPVDSLSRGSGEFIPFGAAPHSFEQPNPLNAAPIIPQGPLYGPNVMQSGQLYCQPGVYSQGQYNNVPQMWLPGGMAQNLIPAGFLNGEVLYQAVADVFIPSGSAAPPLNTYTSKKRKRQNQQDDGRPYIKKPPNAFMLFRKEQAPNVCAELNISDSAMVNTILGQKWKSLSKEEQDKYYEEARKEKLLHTQQHPDWSSRDNYGKQRKRKRSMAPTTVEASASKPGEVTQQAKKLCVTPVQTAVMEPSTSQAGLIEPSIPEAGVMEPFIPETNVMEPFIPETNVMEPFIPEAGVMEPFIPETNVMEPFIPETNVMEPFIPEAGVMEPFIPETNVMEPFIPEAGVMELFILEAGLIEPSIPEAGVMEPFIPETNVMEPFIPEAGVMEPFIPETGLMEPSTSPQVLMQSPHTQTAETVLDFSDLLDIYWEVTVEVTQQAKKLFVTPVQTAVMSPPPCKQV